jgi:proton-dependent oligopeptide transporter, POT family
MSGTPDNGSDLSRDSLLAQLGSFGAVYWLANWMEMVERFAYYGVRVVLPVFMVAAFEQGGPELTQIQKGSIYAVWAVVQSFIPILSGGFADRYGYKVNIAMSTVLKVIGYLVMGYSLVIAEWLCGMTLREARPLGADRVYEIFFAGAMLLAVGTAIFKPGVQGLIATKMPKHAASLGWGVFYQMVNVGGFLGPLLAGYLRVIKWEYVFLACSAAIMLNFVPLFLFKEPARPRQADSPGPLRLLYDAVRGLLEPRLFFFTISFAGFWLMAYQLFDILPNFIDDWVDSRGAAGALIRMFGADPIPTVNGGNLTQEWILNFNALLISVFAFGVGYVTGRLRSLTAIVVGIALAAVSIYALGMSMNGWWTLGAIGLFSLGEMMASPTKLRYLAGIAPPGKEGQYMGYANFTVGIGWSVGSIVAGHLYEYHGDKVNLARRYLVDHAHVAQNTVDAVSKNDLLPFFETTVGVDAWQTRQLLWDTYAPYSMWWIFTLIGAASMVAIIVYNHVVTAAAANPAHSFNTHGQWWVRVFLAPIYLVFLAATCYEFSIGLALNTAFFLLMLVVSLARTDSREAKTDEGFVRGD